MASMNIYLPVELREELLDPRHGELNVSRICQDALRQAVRPSCRHEAVQCLACGEKYDRHAQDSGGLEGTSPGG